MMEICGDNRFEIIAKAKEHLLDATNIDTSPKEMEVLDDFLFRCWQMGWLDRYDRKTESNSEKPNNCDTCKWEDKSNGCPWASMCKCEYEPKDEPTTQTETQKSNLSFEKADEPQSDEDCDYCKMTHKYWYEHCGCCEYKPKDEPQTDCAWK